MKFDGIAGDGNAMGKAFSSLPFFSAREWEAFAAIGAVSFLIGLGTGTYICTSLPCLGK